MIIILFGLSGSGKTFIGNLLASEFGFAHFDGDQFLTLKMKDSMEKKEGFTQEIVDEFTLGLINKIEHLHKTYPKLVISQGLYRSKNRLQILEAFKEKEEILFIQINSKIMSKRILDRNNHVSLELAEKISANFEKMPEAIQIQNDSDGNQALINQLKSILAPS